MARQARRARGHRPGPHHRAAHRRDHPRHLDRALWLGPAPLRGPRAVHGGGRRPRPRADGHRRGGRRRGRRPAGRRPRRRAVQHLLRALLHVRARAADPVRDDAGARAGHGRCPVRLHEALRPGARRPGRAPARAPGPLRADQGSRGTAGRPLPLPLRRPADRVAGGPVRADPRRRQRSPSSASARSARWPAGSLSTSARARSSGSTSCPSAWRARRPMACRRST